MLFIGCCVIAAVSILQYWQHLAKLAAAALRTPTVPLLLGPATPHTDRLWRLFSTEPDEKAHERAAARKHLVRAFAAVAAGLLSVSLVFVVDALA